MGPQWHREGEPRSKKKGDPEKLPMVFNSVARLWTKHVKQTHAFMHFSKSRKVKKNVATWDPAWQVLSPGEEVGGGVNLLIEDLSTSKPPIAQELVGFKFSEHQKQTKMYHVALIMYHVGRHHKILNGKGY